MISEDLPTTTPGSKSVHVAQATGGMEWYTPDPILEIARATLGVIELDPASSAAAQERVQAVRYFDVADDGLAHQWDSGNVWLNPPYAAGLIARFAHKLVEEVRFGHVDEALWLSNNATDTVWFAELTSIAMAMFFPKGRIRFHTPAGERPGTPLQGQVLVYVGPDVARFAAATRVVPGFLCSPLAIQVRPWSVDV